MATWGFFDWLGYGTFGIGAIIMALQAGIGGAPSVAELSPAWFRRRIWLFAPAAFGLVSLIAFVIGAVLPNPDYQSEPIIMSYGNRPGAPYSYQPGNVGSLQGELFNGVMANGRLIQNFRKDFRLIAVCFHWNGTIDEKDVADLSRSGLHDIKDGSIEMTVPWSDKYKKEYVDGARQTNYVLLALPKIATADQFSTIRQAQALGAVVLNERGGPP